MDWLLPELNKIWTPQANVSFTINLPANESQVSGHVSHHIDKVLYDTNPSDGGLEIAEQGAIDAALQTPNRQANNTIDIYFVREFDPARRRAGVLGQAQAIGTHALFVSDAGGSGMDLVQIIAHEIGHTLGLNHNADGNGNPSQGVPSTACNVPSGNTFIDVQNGDTDFKDNTSLMYCFANPNRKHIGAPLWFQLNQANPIP